VTGTAVDNAGNSATDPATVSIDVTAPTIDAAADRAANGNGWYNADVLVSFTCLDTLSGIATCPPAQNLGEGTNQSAIGTATDAAGNDSAPATVSGINVDKTAPTISAAATTSSNGAGWYNGDVTVQFTCADTGGSDLPAGACPADEVLSTEGAAVASTAQVVTDAAGNTSDASNVVTVQIDKTAPMISAATTTSPNGAGWYNSDVTVHFTCADTGSGIPAGACPADEVLSAEGAAVASTAQVVTDAAGNTSGTSNVVTVRIDKAAPTLNPVVSPNPALLNGVASVTSGAADALSGLATQSCGALNTSTVGSRSVTCSATDNAGNTASQSANYSVNYNWSGFFQPVDSLPVLNSVKAGQAIPVKFSLSGNQGLGIVAAGSPVSTGTTCGSTATDDIETTVTAGSSSLSYNATTDQYNYVWKTDKAWANTCRTLTVKLLDGTIHQANFKFTK
jgi:hypothetical protein